MKNLVFGLLSVVVFGAVAGGMSAQSHAQIGGLIGPSFKMRDVEPDVVKEVERIMASPDVYRVQIPDQGSILIGGIRRMIWIIQGGQEMARAMGWMDDGSCVIPYGIVLCDNSNPSSDINAFDRGFLTPLFSRPINDADNRPPSWTIIIIP